MVEKRFHWKFWYSAVLYALVVLTAGYFGLRYLWDYAAAYEQARPYHAIDGYMAQLTPQYICDRSQDLIDTIDHHIQSEEACRAVIAEAVSGGLTYAKKTSECTDTRIVYVLRTGNRVIGTVELAPEGEAVMGYTPWAVISDSFDLSYLVTDTVATTVPEEFSVFVNGSRLTEQYITEEGIRYSNLKDYYGEYDLPTIVSYAAGPCLGKISLTVEDTAGNPVVINEDTDYNQFLDNCSPEEKDQMKALIDEFISRYIRFSNSSRDVAKGNYNYLMPLVVKNSPLAARLKGALGALNYGAPQRYQIKSVELNWCTDIGDGRYICDVTYVVDIRVNKEMVENVFQVKLVILRSDKDLRVETLRNY